MIVWSYRREHCMACHTVLRRGEPTDMRAPASHPGFPTRAATTTIDVRNA